MSYRFLPKLINGGKDLFSITSTYDVARAQVFLASRAKSVSGEVFNVANDPTNYRQINDIISEYYQRKSPTFSIKYWVFKFILPFLKFLKKMFPKAKLIQTATSPIAVNYIGKSNVYNSDKIKKLGFKFVSTPRDAIMECLVDLDPDKKLVKMGKQKV